MPEMRRVVTRRRIIPDRAPATGISGTRGAYDLCAGCRHARVKHLTGPLAGCASLIWADSYDTPDSPEQYAQACSCPGFSESEE